MSDQFHKQTTLPELSAADPPPPLPKKIGPYKIESFLGKGGMSYLYLGLHPVSSKPLVIKVLPQKFSQVKEMTGRFLKEAQIIAMTNHPNIIKLYGQGQWEKGLYIAMEFIQGISLRQFIQQKSLSKKKALEIILQVAYALCHLHTHGVIHRDLKPENILITETGDVKVIDFGIAQLRGGVGNERITQSRGLMGTPIYMSPEQKENPQKVSYSSDIYSLGIIAYELVLGRLSHGVIHLALLPKGFRPIIEKALQPQPKERYQDIVDFITDVSQYIKSLASEDGGSEETSDEMLDMIQSARAILIPKKNPHWPHAEIGIAIHEGISLCGLYLDFFRLSGNRFAIVVAELLQGAADLFSCAQLRGCVRMAIELFFQNGKKDQHPVKMLNSINSALCSDSKRSTFGLSLLVLNPDKDQLSFISCQHSSLWHIPEGNRKMRKLTTPNPALGVDPNAIFLETADNWTAGDILLLPSSTLNAKDELISLALERSALSPQPQAEQLLQKMSAHSNRASLILSLQRIF